MLQNKEQFCDYIFNQAAEGCDATFPSLAEGVVLMSTYEKYMLILALSQLFIAVFNMGNKK